MYLGLNASNSTQIRDTRSIALVFCLTMNGLTPGGKTLWRRLPVSPIQSLSITLSYFFNLQQPLHISFFFILLLRSFRVHNGTIMEAEDKGHRHGNFPNYYSFHPPQNRLNLLEQCGLMAYIRRELVVVADDVSELGEDEAKKSTSSPRKKSRLDDNESCAAARETKNDLMAEKGDMIYYCDLGCNEGDLTMAMASLLRKAVHNNEHTVRCLGLDIDASLVQRASEKFSRKDVDVKSEKQEFMPVFKDCNLCSNDEHNTACSSFFVNTTNAQQEVIPQKMFFLTTIFSTTMWIHIHAGDDGLTKFLERACGWTKKYLLIEPQHSGW